MDNKFETLIQLLQTSSISRTTKKIHQIESFVSSLPYFKQKIIPEGEEVLFKICEHLTYEFGSIGQYLFKTGDYGTSFYVILKGSVRVLALESDDTEKLLYELSDGIGFGEYSLLNNLPRLASIQCASDCHFGVLSKETYLKYLGRSENKKLEDLIKFLRNFYFFKNWGRLQIIKISYLLKEKTFPRKTVIFKEGDLAKEIIFIKEGELKLVKSVRNDKECKSPYFRSCSPNHRADIAIIGPKEIVGDEILSEKVYSYSCKVYSFTATILSILKSDFLDKIRSEESQYTLITNSQVKEQARNFRISSLKTLKTVSDYYTESTSPIKTPCYDKGTNPRTLTPYKKGSHTILKNKDSSKSNLDIPSLSNFEYTKKAFLKLSPFGIKTKKYGFNKYIHPIKIEQKKLYERLKVFRNKSKYHINSIVINS
jgi:CRP-like cAMP-binding protein